MVKWFKRFFQKKTKMKVPQWSPKWTAFLNDKVAFYRVLSLQDKRLFHQRILLFLETTAVEARETEVTDEDRLLIAASAIIPVWGFPKWHYFNLNAVYLLPFAFNQSFDCGRSDSFITGMVGTGSMSGRMVLSKTALHYGFGNSKDKRNVGIHEFVHLVDMADGECDGYPERLKEHAFSIPWFELVDKKIKQIDKGKSNIDDYGGTNRSEFFAVVSEYFFERPAMLARKHPELFAALNGIYKQEVLHIEADIKLKQDSLCACGSKDQYQLCCMPMG